MSPPHSAPSADAAMNAMGTSQTGLTAIKGPRGWSAGGQAFR